MAYKENRLHDEFRQQVLRIYKAHCFAETVNIPVIAQAYKELSLSQLIELTNSIIKTIPLSTDININDIPLSIDYIPIYSYSALEYILPAIENAVIETDYINAIDLKHLLRYARIFLNAGSYKNCIKCCQMCLDNKTSKLTDPKFIVEILFAESKAYRNMGEYEKALEKLLSSLKYIDENEKVKYLKGSAILRIGKVYSEFLMMIGVSICFLEEAKEQLEEWIESDDSEIRQRVERDYAICLDEMGQYWRGKAQPIKATPLFEEAQRYNKTLNRKSGEFRNVAHLISINFGNTESCAIEKGELINNISVMEYIIRQLMDDGENQKGIGVRLLQLAKLQAIDGDRLTAIENLNESKRYSRLYRDDKTLIKAVIAELEYKIYEGEIDRTSVMQALDLARERKYYEFEITLNQLVVDYIDNGLMRSTDMLPCLQRNYDLYMYLSGEAKKIINSIISRKSDDEFKYLSEKTTNLLLRNLVSDYDWFVQKMKVIINNLLKITEIRSQKLTVAAIAEAKATVATGVLHDLKHILIAGDGSTTYLDEVIRELEHWEGEVPRERREELIRNIHMVNENLKLKIYPSILEATRMPNNFKEEISVQNVFSDISRQKPEEYQNLSVDISFECVGEIIIEYNYRIFSNLIKELLRNAMDYQRKTNARIYGYCLKAKESYGQITFSILTDFARQDDAQSAYNSIYSQLSATSNESREDGFGFTLLKNFVHAKTAGAAAPQATMENCKVGVTFVVPKK